MAENGSGLTLVWSGTPQSIQETHVGRVAPITKRYQTYLQKKIYIYIYITCLVSLVACHLSPTLTATATDPPPANYPTMQCRPQTLLQCRLVCQDIIFVYGNQPIAPKTPNNFKTQVKLIPRNPPPPKIIVMCLMSHVTCQKSQVKCHISPNHHSIQLQVLLNS